MHLLIFCCGLVPSSLGWQGNGSSHGKQPDECAWHVQANIKEQQYNVSWFKSFDLVLNGLDNLEARRHVNRMCLVAEVPLVESGTAAYLGQVR